jgi:hypothetical protein
MSLEIVKLDDKEWANVSEDTLKYSFLTDWPKEKNRVDFALIVQNPETKAPYCFATVLEFDSESAYMQHGGNFPASRGTILTTKGYLMMIGHLKERYKSVSTRIWNKNKAMLKLAWAAGFCITGTQQDKFGDIYLIHELEYESQEKCEPMKGQASE